jgi:hypothetical protein
MGKTRVQYQKVYRERKKLQDKHCLKRERERTKKYKTTIAAVSKENIGQRQKWPGYICIPNIMSM